MIQKTVLFTTAKIFWGGTLLFIDVITAPSFNMLFVVMGAIAIDFITGIAKAKAKKVARTSEGFRKTVVKLMQYLVPILVLWVASKRVPGYETALKEISGWLMLFITYIEVTSIFENLYKIDNKTVIAKYVYKPALRLLKFGIENNAVVKAAEKLDEKEAPKPNQP
jgi:phage-related holin